jgi:DNA-binding beta-propeller fold protein YncE
VKAKHIVLEAARARMLAIACFGLLVLAGNMPAQQGASGYHLVKSVKIEGPGGWDYLSIDPETRRLFISHGTHVVVLNADTGAVVGDIPDTPGVHGVALAPDLNRAFSSNGQGNNVSILDLKTLKKIGEVPAGKDPDAIIYDPVSRRVFAMNRVSHNATAIDGANGMVAGTIPFPGNPEFAAADGHGKVFVNIESKSQVAEIDSQTLKVLHYWPLAPCKEPSGMAIDAAHGRLFVGCDNHMMAVVDTQSGKIVATVPTGDGVDANRFDPGTGWAFSSNGESQTITVVHEDSPDKYTVVDNVKTGEGGRTMEVDPKTHNVYIMTAKLIPAKPFPRPAPGTLQLLIFAR